MTTSQSVTTSYAMEVGCKGQERLAILNQVCNPYTLEFLAMSGLKSGMNVLDLGCGTGLMSVHLARIVGSTGSVTAVDVSDEQLQIALSEAKKEGIENITFVELDAYKICRLQKQFDFIYSRFMLCHVLQPEDIVAGMVQCLVPGGRIVIEEAVGNEGLLCVPQSQAFQKWEKIYRLQFQLQETDSLIGCRLPHIFSRLGLETERVRLLQPVLTTSYEKKQLRLGVVEVAPKLIAAGLISEKEIEETLRDLEVFEVDPSYFVSFVRYAQIAVRN
jgi:2-polyprenyl-3-methyl-5-hydroxy-6-metoxy-1,4-benzoquinol methylase